MSAHALASKLRRAMRNGTGATFSNEQLQQLGNAELYKYVVKNKYGGQLPGREDVVKALTDAAAAEPKQAAVDGQSADNYPLPDRLALESRRAAEAAASGANANGGARSGWGMLRPAQAILPGHNG